MTYVCELNNGQRVFLENSENQTTLTLVSQQAGQQQQSSSGFTTGAWIAPPQAFATEQGVVLQINTQAGMILIQVQGQSVGLSQDRSLIQNRPAIAMQQVAHTPMVPIMAPMQPLQPLPPLQPMVMGNMQMTMQPMEMRMGNMVLKTDNQTNSPANPLGNQVDNPSSSSDPQAVAAKHKFCTQCGSAIQESDRFCGSCGHRLS